MIQKGLKGVASGTGRDVAKFLTEFPDRAPTKMVVIHSLNESGSKVMYNILKDKVRCPIKLIPFVH